MLSNGVTAPVNSYPDAIRESVWVLAPDSDGNGEADRVAVDIVRPRELAAAGVPVPVIMDASPYYLCCGRGNEGELKTYTGADLPEKLPLFYDNYFVPRGYGYVAVDLAGTGRSTGCVDQGGASDIGSVKAVVEWLYGDADAVDAAGAPVEATWSAGKVGMIGKSYDGTLANGVAATGVAGLKTIVPISAISTWYDYTRYDGLPTSWNYPSFLSGYVARERTERVDCADKLAQMAADDADETGAHNGFWAARNYLTGGDTRASNVAASALVYHGLQDTNVRTTQFAKWWRALGSNGVDQKLWLTRLGHVDPFDSDRRRWVRTLHRWFDSELMGIDNGIRDEPAASVEVRPNTWRHSPTWPVNPRQRTALFPRRDGSLAKGGPGTGRASWVNAPNLSEANAVSAGSEENRLLFASRALARDTRISGEATVRLRATSQVRTGQVGVLLVDYGLASRVLATGDGARTTANMTCHGQATEADDACYFTVERVIGRTPAQVLARGFTRLDGARTHDLNVRLTADDTVVPAGHRLGLVVVAAAPSRVRNVDDSESTYTLALAATRLSVPGNLRFTGAQVDGRAAWLPSRGELLRGSLPVDGRRQVPLA